VLAHGPLGRRRESRVILGIGDRAHTAAAHQRQRAIIETRPASKSGKVEPLPL
jgi:hypothetical protein